MSIIIEYGRFDQMEFKNLDDFISAVAKKYQTEPKNLKYAYLEEYIKCLGIDNIFVQYDKPYLCQNKYGNGKPLRKIHRFDNGKFMEEVMNRVAELEQECSEHNSSAKSFDKNDIDIAKNNKQKGAKEL